MATASLKLVLSESSVSIANNTSKVTAKLYFYGNGLSWSNYDCPGSITIAGTTYSFTHTHTKSTSAQLLATKSKTIKHKADGSATVSVSAKFNSVGTSAIGTLKTSASKTLTKIARMSSLSLSDTSVNIGETITPTIIGHTGVSDTLTFKFGSIKKGMTSKKAFKITEDMAKQIPNSTSGTASVTLKCTAGGTTIGTKTVNVTIKVPNTNTPTVKFGSITEGNDTVKNAGLTAFIQKYSKLITPVTATPKLSSTIKTISITVDGTTYSKSSVANYTLTTNAIKASGSVTITAKATDSRGYTGSATTSVSVAAYSPPSITNFTVSMSADKKQATLKITGKFSEVGKNSGTLQISKKLVTASAYDSLTSYAGSAFNNKEVSFTASGLTPETTYDFRAVCQDKLNAVTKIINNSTVCISRYHGGDGVTLFKNATAKGFWVGDIDYTINTNEYDTLINTLNAIK